MKEKMRKIAEQLESKGEMRFLEAATADQIADFEKKQGVLLPEQYKEWLLVSDGGELFLPAGVQLYGVAHKPLIDVNDNDRPDENYVVIGALASGDPVIYRKGQETTAIYNMGAGRIEEDEIYEDFSVFLNNLDVILGIGG